MIAGLPSRTWPHTPLSLASATGAGLADHVIRLSISRHLQPIRCVATLNDKRSVRGTCYRKTTTRNVLSSNQSKPATAAAPRASAHSDAMTSADSDAHDSRQRKPLIIGGLEELAASGKYEAWILDQFGVLHDGRKAYPDAIRALQRLAATGAKIVLLSNSSRRVEVATKKLPTLGFDSSLFCGIVTSGEITHRNLKDRSLDPSGFFPSLGYKCLHFTWGDRGAVKLEGLGLQVVDSPEHADFILAHGTEAVGRSDGGVEQRSLAEMEALMRRAVEEGRRRRGAEGGQGASGFPYVGIPMVVANPDLVTVEERALRVMPGTLAKQYEEMGGVVRRMGKPDPVAFREAQRLTGVPLDRTVMVGDSLHHDIMGASTFGIDSVFVAGGIHAAELGVPAATATVANVEGSDGGDSAVASASLVDKDGLETLLANVGASPTYVIPYFGW